jgi:transaldolase
MTKEGVKYKQHFLRKVLNECNISLLVKFLLAANKAGATYVSPFIGRLDDISTGMDY